MQFGGIQDWEGILDEARINCCNRGSNKIEVHFLSQKNPGMAGGSVPGANPGIQASGMALCIL